MNAPAIFVDWVSVAQYHPAGGFPVLVSGIKATFDSSGNPRFECGLSESVSGSFETSVRVLSNGYLVALSGNPGRFGRKDNLFNHGWAGTIEAANRIVTSLGLPAFTIAPGQPEDSQEADLPGNRGAMSSGGCVVSRIDLTCNYSAGSPARAREVIRWLSSRSVSRMKRGYSSDESVWFTNTRHMLKAYRKGAEMKKHSPDSEYAAWAEQEGIVRVEVELKRRLLEDLNLRQLGDITDEKLAEVFTEQTEIFRRVDMSDEPDIIEALPPRFRMTAAAWLAGQDVRGMMSRATVFRHAKVLREYGIDILEPRDINRFPTRVRVIDLQPVAVPDWYSLKAA